MKNCCPSSLSPLNQSKSKHLVFRIRRKNFSSDSWQKKVYFHVRRSCLFWHMANGISSQYLYIFAASVTCKSLLCALSSQMNCFRLTPWFVFLSETYFRFGKTRVLKFKPRCSDAWLIYAIWDPRAGISPLYIVHYIIISSFLPFLITHLPPCNSYNFFWC